MQRLIVIDPVRRRWCVLRAALSWAGWLTLAWCPTVFAQDSANGVELSFKSGHADRGFVISDRPVVQPEMWVSGGFGELSLWSNFTLAETTDSARPEIFELELTHEQRWKSLTIAPAVTMVFYYDPLSRSGDRTTEGWLRLSYDVGPFRLFANHSVNVRTRAYYGEAGIESAGHVSPGVAVGGSLGTGWASAAFNDDYADLARAALDHVSAECWLTVHLGSHFYIGPDVEFSTTTDRRVRAMVARPTYFLISLVTGGEF